MRKIKFLLFFLFGLVLLTSCGLNHTSYPKQEVPFSGADKFVVTVKDFETKQEIAQVSKMGGYALRVTDFSYNVPEGYTPSIVDEDGMLIDVSRINGDMTVYVMLSPLSYPLAFYEHGTIVEKQYVEYGSAIELIDPKMVPSGYEFLGWYTEKDGGELFASGEMPAHALSLYAHYEQVPYSINFVTGLAELAQYDCAAEFFVGDRLGDFVPAALKQAMEALDQYSFVGWYTDAALTKPFEEVTMPSHDVTLYAKWAFEGISFNDGDVIIDVPTPNEQGYIERPADPEKQGYTFEDWYLDENFNTLAVFPIEVTGEAFKIYAKFIPNDNTAYHVEYYLRALNGSYIRQEVIEYYGTTDAQISALIKSYTGFHFDESNSLNKKDGKILADESLLLKVYYARNEYQISFLNCDLEPITYLYGQSIGAIAEPEQTGQTFIGWDIQVPATMPAADVVLTAQWSTNAYRIKFISEGVELQSSNVNYGEMPVYSGTEPTKPADAQYTYTFIGWDPEIEVVTGAVTYTAVFSATVNQYEIKFVSEGVELQSGFVAYGQTPVYAGETPVKAANAQYTYTFSGWDPEIEAVSGVATYTAQFSATVNEYEIKFVSEGVELQSGLVAYGQTPVYNGTMPAKEATAQYTYVFSGWNPEIEAVSGAQTYTAQFEALTNKYLVKFVCEGQTLQEGEVEFGQTPVYTGVTPTKEATAQYTYTFSGWEPEIEAVSGIATYTATFSATVNEYEIKFVSEGVELQSGLVAYGQTPVYNGETPTKPATAQYTYTFSGWNPEIEAVSGAATYIAQFDATVNEYEIKFVSEGVELQSGLVAYGETPVYNGETPVKAATAQYTYTFSGWNPEIEAVSGAATYTAQFDATVNEYEIKFVSEGVELQSGLVAYGQTPVFAGEEPTKAATAQYTYTFTGWDPEIEAVSGAATYTAQFSATTNSYLIKFIDCGETVQSETINYGEPIVAPADPVQEGYIFLGWEPEVPATVSGAAEFVAQWQQIVYQDLAFYMNGTGTAANHVDGAGIWVWLDTASIGMTGANFAEYQTSATVEGYTVTQNFLSDLNSTYVRSYVVLNMAPNPAEVTEVVITIKHGNDYYRGSISFKNGKVYDPNAIYMVTGLEHDSRMYLDYGDGDWNVIDLSEPVAFGTVINVLFDINDMQTYRLYGVFINNQKIEVTFNGSDYLFSFTVEGNTDVNIVLISDADILPLALYLDGEGNTRNHIEGAGAWIWLDTASLNVTPQNQNSMILTVACDALAVNQAFFSDFTADYYRLYVVTNGAPAADQVVTYAVEIFDGSKVYQTEVKFLNGELYAPKAARLGDVDYATIQKAIDASSSNDTIYVYPGSWNEELTINKNITLASEANMNVAGYSDSRQAESIITGAVTITSNGVIINGLAFAEAGTIKVNASNVTLTNIKMTAEPAYVEDNLNAQVFSGEDIAYLTITDSYFNTGELSGTRDCLGFGAHDVENIVIQNCHFENEVAAGNLSNDEAIRIKQLGGYYNSIVNNVFNFSTGSKVIYLGEGMNNTYKILIKDNVLNGVGNSSTTVIYLRSTINASEITVEHNEINTTGYYTLQLSGSGHFNFFYNYFGNSYRLNNSSTNSTIVFEGNCYKEGYTSTAPSDYQAYADYDKDAMEAAYYAWLHPSVAYDLDGGAWNGEEGLTTLTHNTEYTLPTNVQKEGYEFLGWFVGDVQVTSVLNKQVSVKAHWKLITYTLTFNLDGGFLPQYNSYEEIRADLLADYNSYKGASYTYDTVPLSAWGNIDISGFFYSTQNEVKMSEKWAWLANYLGHVGGSANKPGCLALLAYNSSSDFSAANGNYVYEVAYEFKAFLKGIKFTGNSNYPTSDYTLEELQNGMFDAQYGVQRTIYSALDELELVTPTKTLYDFLGWYDNANFEGDPITEISVGTNHDVELFARFEIRQYSITYYPREGLENFEFGTVVKTINTTASSGYWSTSETDIFLYSNLTSSDNAKYSARILIRPLVDGKLYLVDTVTLSGGSFSVSQIQPGDLVIIASEGNSTGYNQVKTLTVGQYVFIDGSIETGVAELSVYDSSEVASMLTTDTYIVGTGKVLPVLQRDGYDFVGWFDNAAFNGDPIESVSTSDIGNKVFYAKWLVLSNNGTVTWDANGGNVSGEASGSFEYTVGDTVVLPTPEKENYVFRGWYQNDTLVTTIEAGDYNLVAHWDLMIAFINDSTVGYGSITEAIEVATAGDTINVIAGQYTEELNVNKSVTILGPNASVLGKDTRSEEAILKGAVTLSVADVTLKGLRFESTGTITVNADGATIENCYVQATAINPGANNRKGMIISNVSIKDLTIRGNYLYCGAYLQGPIDLCGLASNVVIDNNVFTNGITVGNNVNEGLLLYNAAGELTITNNDFLFPTDNWAILVYGSTLAHALIQDNVINTANGVDHTSGIAVYNTPATCVMDFIHNKFYSTTGTTFRFTGGKAGTTINFYYNYFDAASPVKFNCLATAVVNFEGDCYGTAINTATNLTPTDYVEYAEYGLAEMEYRYNLNNVYGHNGLLSDPFDVDSAKEYINTLDDNAISPYKITVTGVAKSSSYNGSYGSYTIWLADSSDNNGVQLYSAVLDSAYNNISTEDNYLSEATIICTGYAKKYVKNSTVTPEISYVSASASPSEVADSPLVTSIVFPQYDVTVEQSENGTLTVNSDKVEKYQNITITVTPNDNYVFTTLYVNDVDTPFTLSNNTIVLSNIQEDIVIRGLFAEITYNALTVTYDNTKVDVEVTGATDLDNILSGTEITISIAALSGFAIQEVTKDGNEVELVNGQLVFTITDDTVIAISAEEDYSGDYLIVYKADESNWYAFNGGLATLDAANNNVKLIVNNGVASYSDPEAIKFTLAKVSGGYTIKSASGNYIGQTSYGNGLVTSSTTSYTNSISIDSNGDWNLVITTSGGDVTLKYNKSSGQERFRYFKSGQQSICLIPLSEVLTLSDSNKVAADKEALNISQNGQEITEGFTLPSVGSVYNSAITWASNNAAITIDGSTASVHRASEDVIVTLTATLTLNSESTTKEFSVTVKAAVTQYAVEFVYESTQVEVNKTNGDYDEGSFSFTVNPKQGYEIVSVSDGVNTLVEENGEYQITLSDDVTITISSQATQSSSSLKSITYSMVGGTTTNEINASAIKDLFDATSGSIVNSVKSASKVYGKYNNYESLGLKFGTSSVNGTFAITTSKTVYKVEVVAAGWTTSDVLTVNNVQDENVSFSVAYSGSNPTVTMTFEFEDGVTDLTFLFAKRGFIQSITLYYEE